jgi:hypothetical protein
MEKVPMLESLTYEMFAKQLNSKFSVRLENGGLIELELIEVEDGRTSGQERFSLLFRGPLDQFLPQRIHALEHETLGQLGLFLVPVRQEPDGLLYEAIFNRLPR